MMNIMDDSKKKNPVALIMSKMGGEESSSENEGEGADAAQALIDAIKSGNASDVKSAFKAMMMKCEGEDEESEMDSASAE